MKIILFGLALFCTSFAEGQTVRETVEDAVSGVKEKYSVLKADQRIKQGPYESFRIYHNQLICKGFYKNNDKDSLWKFYDTHGNVIEHGYYRDGKKTGVWNSFDDRGEQSVDYDYTNNTLLFLKLPKRDTGKYSVLIGNDTSRMKLDRPPVYLEGEGRFLTAMITGMRYPATARENNVQGKVIVAFTVDQQGAVSNYRIKKSIGSGCDEEAIKAIKHIEGDWLPGLLNGKPVSVEYEVPLMFTLATN